MMTDKPKDKRRDDLIEFVVPYSLPDCLYRIRDTKDQRTGFLSAGIDPSFEKVQPDVYKFRIRRTWYDQRYRRHSSNIEMRGYFKAIDDTSTAVIAQTHASWQSLIFYSVFTGLVVFSLYFGVWRGKGFWLAIIPALMLAFFWLLSYFDRRTLRYVLHKALSDNL